MSYGTAQWQCKQNLVFLLLQTLLISTDYCACILGDSIYCFVSHMVSCVTGLTKGHS